MAKILPVINIGSINIDHTYRTPHLVEAGETLSSDHYLQGLGGKGMNQSIALHRAGVPVVHVGAIGCNDQWTLAQLDADISTTHIARVEMATGHAIIEVSASGENRIILYPGANHTISRAQILEAFSASPESQYVLTQNETNALSDIIELSAASDKKLVLNPAPFSPEMKNLPLEKVDILIVNEIELIQLSGLAEQDIEAAIAKLRANYPATQLVITLGAAGVRYVDSSDDFHTPARPVDAVVDTTGAGDTFIGYFLAGLSQQRSVREAIAQGVAASAITISRHGAARSIPYRTELFEN